ncbi:MAG: acyl-CoA dehydrogenase family protein [Desulfobacterales bacterium]|nr:acyl-CoA dehydrogenase family protein [Desulfobacterales bacterium]
MSYSPNPYTFDDFLEWRNQADYYAEDLFFQKTVKFYAAGEWEYLDRAAREISGKVSFRWKELAEAAAVPEKQPYITHYDGHNHRIDRIVRPMETLVLEKEVFGEKLFSKQTSPFEKLVKMYLIYQNGEACIACPLTCTEGLVALLEYYADTPELRHILAHCKEGIDGDIAIGSQFLSEIQGGSDVPANLVEAVEEEGGWRLYGDKFFCSATHADYAVVTARPRVSEKVGLFVVPAWLPGNREREIRNSYTINRIKWKMGTSELTTGEISYNGAVAYPVGPLDKGVANVVGIVLTFSRLTVGLTSAAVMARAVREAMAYSRRRTAFGVTIGDFPLVRVQMEEMEALAQGTTAGAFKLYRDFLGLDGGLKKGLNTDEPLEMKRKRFNIRQLIMLQKIVSAQDCTDVVRTAMSVFGGHGVMEDFSALPRLYRDSAINELWEGPRNVLLTQIHRDFQRVADWYRPGDVVASILRGGEPDTITRLASEAEALTALPLLAAPDKTVLQTCRRWDAFCTDLTHGFQAIARAEVAAS